MAPVPRIPYTNNSITQSASPQSSSSSRNSECHSSLVAMHISEQDLGSDADSLPSCGESITASESPSNSPELIIPTTHVSITRRVSAPASINVEIFAELENDILVDGLLDNFRRRNSSVEVRTNRVRFKLEKSFKAEEAKYDEQLIRENLKIEQYIDTDFPKEEKLCPPVVVQRRRKLSVFSDTSDQLSSINGERKISLPDRKLSLQDNEIQKRKISLQDHQKVDRRISLQNHQNVDRKISLQNHQNVDRKISLQDNKNYFIERKRSLQDHNNYYTNRKASLQDNKCYYTDRKISLQDNKTVERKISLQDSKVYSTDRSTYFTDRKLSLQGQDRKISAHDRKISLQERKISYSNGTHERKINSSERRVSSQHERKTSQNERKISFTDTLRAVVGTKKKERKTSTDTMDENNNVPSDKKSKWSMGKIKNKKKKDRKHSSELNKCPSPRELQRLVSRNDSSSSVESINKYKRKSQDYDQKSLTSSLSVDTEDGSQEGNM